MVREEEGEIPLVQNLLRLEIWYISTHTYVASKKVPHSATIPLIFLK